MENFTAVKYVAFSVMDSSEDNVFANLKPMFNNHPMKVRNELKDLQYPRREVQLQWESHWYSES